MFSRSLPQEIWRLSIFNGNLVWKKNLGLPNNPYGSVDGKFGILYLTEANSDQFTILSKVRLLDKSRCWAPLALSRGKLIIHDDKQMKCMLVK